jgi:hypothetical protein
VSGLDSGRYVFTLAYPDDGAVFSVGMGTGGRIDHERDARNEWGLPRHDLIRWLDGQGTRPVKRRVSRRSRRRLTSEGNCTQRRHARAP